MKTAGIQELKQELLQTSPAALAELCLHLAKFKKENKELLTYLLFEAHDEQAYIASVNAETDRLFAGINNSNLYYVKKSLQKIVRTINKYARYAGSAQVTIELLIHFCNCVKESGIPINKNKVITNLYNNQVQKINKLLATLHEDLQYDYQKTIKNLDL